MIRVIIFISINALTNSISLMYEDSLQFLPAEIAKVLEQNTCDSTTSIHEYPGYKMCVGAYDTKAYPENYSAASAAKRDLVDRVMKNTFVTRALTNNDKQKTLCEAINLDHIGTKKSELTGEEDPSLNVMDIVARRCELAEIKCSEIKKDLNETYEKSRISKKGGSSHIPSYEKAFKNIEIKSEHDEGKTELIIPKELVQALASQESGGNIFEKYLQARGLFQINDTKGSGAYKVGSKTFRTSTDPNSKYWSSSIYNPENNFEALADLIQFHWRRLVLEMPFLAYAPNEQKLKFLLSGYNAGSTHIIEAYRRLQIFNMTFGVNIPYTFENIERFDTLDELPLTKAEKGKFLESLENVTIECSSCDSGIRTLADPVSDSSEKILGRNPCAIAITFQYVRSILYRSTCFLESTGDEGKTDS